jgi:hypothetical protein
VLLSNTNGGDNSDLFVSEVMPGVPPGRTLPSSITAVSQVRYYRIQRSGNSGTNFRITLPYGADDGVSDPAGLTIAKDDGSGAWLDIGGLASGAAPGSIQSDVFNGFSDFVLANKTGGSNALPVTWLSFDAFKNGTAAKLNWRTGTEANCSRYVVERSTNGNRFEAIATLPCANSQIGSAYTYTDAAPGSGIVYYRIRQVDDDGKTNISAIRQINFGPENRISLFPNPTSGRLTILNLPVNARYRLNDLQGRTLMAGIGSTQTLILNVASLPTGTYLLQIESYGKTDTQKVVVKK